MPSFVPRMPTDTDFFPFIYARGFGLRGLRQSACSCAETFISLFPHLTVINQQLSSVFKIEILNLGACGSLASFEVYRLLAVESPRFISFLLVRAWT